MKLKIFAIYLFSLVIYVPLYAQQVDLGISLYASATVTQPTDTLHQITPGDSFYFVLTIDNIVSTIHSDSIQVTMVLPDELQFVSSELPIIANSGNFVFWTIDSVSPDSSLTWRVFVAANESIGANVDVIMTQVLLFCPTDASAENNEYKWILQVIRPDDQPKAVDLAIMMEIRTDSTIEQQGSTYPKATADDSCMVLLSIFNKSNITARSIDLGLRYPSELSAAGSTPPFKSQEGQNMFWHVDSMAALSGYQFIAKMVVAEVKTDGILSLDAFVTTEYDTLDENNRVSSPIWLYSSMAAETCDLKINFHAVTDSVISVEGEEYPAVIKTNHFAYHLSVENLGPAAAENIQIMVQYTDQVVFQLFSINPDSTNDQLLTWSVPLLQANDEWSVDLLAIANQHIQTLPQLLITTASVFTVNDLSLNNNFEDGFVFFLAPPLMLPDLSLSVIVDADSFQVSDGDSVAVIDQGGSCDLKFRLSNWGDIEAKNIQFTFSCLDSLFISQVRPSPDFLSADSVEWKMKSLAPRQSFIFQSKVELPAIMPVMVNQLRVSGRVLAENEDLSKLYNNAFILPMINQGVPVEPMVPQIHVDPENAQIGDKLMISVLFPTRVKEWDLIVHLPNGELLNNFADHYISATAVNPGVWYQIDEGYQHLQLYHKDSDEIIFEVTASGFYHNHGSAQTHATVTGRFGVELANVFRTEDVDFPIDLFIPEAHVQIQVFDLSGRKVTQVVDTDYPAGKHTVLWNVKTESGQLVGSGTYLMMLQIGDQKLWKKFIIVR